VDSDVANPAAGQRWAELGRPPRGSADDRPLPVWSGVGHYEQPCSGAGHRAAAPAPAPAPAPLRLRRGPAWVGQAAASWQLLVAVSQPKTASWLVAEYAGVQVVSTMVGCAPCGPATFARTLVSSGGTTVLPVTV